GLDRLLAGLLELGKLATRGTVSDVLVTILSPEVRDYALAVATQLRKAGVETEIYLDENAKLKKQMKYASSLGVPLVVLTGPDEVAAEKVSLRDMVSGEQFEIPLKSLNKEVIARVGTGSQGSLSARSWDWVWDRQSVGRVPESRGVYILRDGSKDAVKVGYVAEGGLRGELESLFDAQRDAGVKSFDWYEVGNVAFGKDLAEFLNMRLVERE
ncbi:MAG: hypothetical protein KDB07_07075, partial [Planctomycetes bacterium]|nr:hypothetical protein [Planctomycetota bacterium]